MNDSIMHYLSFLLITLPIIGCIFNLLSDKNTKKGAQLSTITVGMGLILSLILLGYHGINKTTFYFFGLKADALSFLMSALIFLVSTTVHQFSIRYMAGDKNYQSYYAKLSLITSSATLMVFADQVLLFFMAWCANHLLLVSLMIHKKTWRAARYSGQLAFKTLFFGSSLFIVAISLMYIETNSLSISTISEKSTQSPLMTCAMALCILTAMTQSALWPFHKWLASSLNSPTPVSAIMHAGLVNGGGFLLVRFATLLHEQTLLLGVIFLIGVISSILGTLWKLVQTDVKRMLACSTIGQMGFMMVQCGLGLFSAAIAHLIWHGLFKAFLFLGAGSAIASPKAQIKENKNTFTSFILSCAYGLLGAYCFAHLSDKPFFSMNTTTFLVGFAFIASTQLAHALLKNNNCLKTHLLTFLGSALSGLIYGGGIHLIEMILPSALTAVHPMNSVHLAAFLGFVMIWLILNLDYFKLIQKTNVWKKVYFALLNSSQPHPSTITSIRQFYQY